MKSFLAAVLSLFVPGLGQLYKGHFVQAIVWFLVVGAAYGLLYWFVFALVPMVLHIICILQAYFIDNEEEAGSVALRFQHRKAQYGFQPFRRRLPGVREINLMMCPHT